MSKTDQDRRDSDSIKLATAYLDATRAVESMPPEISDEIWARLERSVLLGAGTHGAAEVATNVGGATASSSSSSSSTTTVISNIRSRRRWWVAVSVAASLAAALLLAMTLSPPERAGAQGASQISAAAYLAKTVEQRAVVEAARPSTPRAESSSARSPTTAATSSTLETSETSETSETATTVSRLQLMIQGSDEDAQNERPRRRSATTTTTTEASPTETSPTELTAADPPGSRTKTPEQPALGGAEAPKVSSLAAETRSLAAIRRALDGGQPARALKLLERHSTAFPEGFLAEEAAALQIVALCKSDDLIAGRAAASEFLQAYPNSALRARVGDACPSPR